VVAELLLAANLVATSYVVWRVKPRIRPRSKGIVAVHRAPTAHDAAPSLSKNEWHVRFRVIGVDPKGVRHRGSYIGDDAKAANAAWDAFRHEHDIKGRFTFFEFRSQHPGHHRGPRARSMSSCRSLIYLPASSRSASRTLRVRR
jgi:hypothetical protein